MDEISQWFASQLSSSAEGLVWSARQISLARREQQPPAALGEWSAARHVFHMLFYEQHIALPGMRQWLGGPLPEIVDEDPAWTGSEAHPHAAACLFRNSQPGYCPAASIWRRRLETWCHMNWGPVSFLWVVSKTYQHTAEHINDVLRIALFWDYFAAQAQDGN